MTQPANPLVTSADPDWAKFEAKDPDYYLYAAGERVRDYCGWHIWPNKTVTVRDLSIKSKGIINLPSMMVTAVHSIVLTDAAGLDNRVLEPGQYDWFENGIIEPAGWQNWSSAFAGGYYGPDNWSYLIGYQHGRATVIFDSGYATVPQDIKEVVMELATTSMEVNAGNVKEVQTPGFRMQPSQPFGNNLNPQQQNRLSKYRLPAVA